MNEQPRVLLSLYKTLKSSNKLEIDVLKTMAVTYMAAHAANYDFRKVTYKGSMRVVGYGDQEDFIKNGYYDETILLAGNQLIYLIGLDEVFTSPNMTICKTLKECQAIKDSITIHTIEDTLAAAEKTLLKAEESPTLSAERPITEEEAIVYGCIENSCRRLLESKGNFIQPVYLVALREKKASDPKEISFFQTEEDVVNYVNRVAQDRKAKSINGSKSFYELQLPRNKAVYITITQEQVPE